MKRSSLSLALSLVLLASAVGCTADDGGGVIVSAKPGVNGVSGGVGGSSTKPSPAPSSSPSPQPSSGTTSTDIRSAIDVTATPAPVQTNPPVSLVTPPPPALGAMVGFPPSVFGTVRAMAIYSNATGPWILSSNGLVQIYGGRVSDATFAAAAPSTLLAADPSNSDLWVAGAGRLDHAVPSDKGVGLAYPTQGLASASLTATPVGLVADAFEVWIANSNGTLTKVVKTSATLTTITPAGITSATAIALDPTNAWVTGGTNSLYRVNRSDGSVTTFAVGSSPIAVVRDSQGTVWTANQGNQTLSRFPSSGATLPPLQLPGTPTAIAANGTRIWVGLSNNMAAWFNLDGSAPGTASLPMSPTAMAVDALGQVWFASTNGQIVTVQGH